MTLLALLSLLASVVRPLYLTAIYVSGGDASYSLTSRLSILNLIPASFHTNKSLLRHKLPREPLIPADSVASGMELEDSSSRVDNTRTRLGPHFA